MRVKWLPAAVLALVACVYAPSLAGGWVWDDHSLLANNPALASVRALWSTDVWSPSGTSVSDLYRPLVMTSYLPGQTLFPGPLSARLGNLVIHLTMVILIAVLGQDLGAGRRAAWLGAALFGVHPGATEPVAWVTGRHDSLPALLLLGAFVALPRRPILAGLLCACAPLAKEPYMLAPLAFGLWAWGRRQWSWPALAIACAGPVAALVGRRIAEVQLPVGAATSDLLAAIGALAARGLTLLTVPASADAAAPYHGNPAIGVLAVTALVGAGVALLRGRRAFALGLAPLVVLLPCAPASAQIDIVADRYFYLAFAMLAVGLSCAASGRRWAPALWGLVAVLSPVTVVRANEWSSDLAVWAASYALHPDNPHAAFHLAYAQQEYALDCASAVPLYEQALAAEPRARTNVMACLLLLGQNERAVALAPRLIAMDPENPKIYAAEARAYVGLGQLDRAVASANRAVAIGGRAEDMILAGNIAGQIGDLDAAERAFRAAQVAVPDSAEAVAGLRAVAARRAAPPPPPVTPPG
ncbi:hypothetical protein LBMAG42_10140 [Deltaproteobacteria bacterium]|nr:hypothetical protein LBMAG42_10140 [Deltaproteobacteria bacterium]